MSEERSKLLRTSAVAKMLDCSCSVVRRLARTGELKAINFIRGVRFRLADVERFIALHEGGRNPVRRKSRTRKPPATPATEGEPEAE